MSERMIGEVEVSGNDQTAHANCTKCERNITYLGSSGAWEEAKHWAIRHVCRLETD